MGFKSKDLRVLRKTLTLGFYDRFFLNALNGLRERFYYKIKLCDALISSIQNLKEILKLNKNKNLSSYC